MRINSFPLKISLIILLTINSFAGFSQKQAKLTKSEIEGILLMREEEKLAHDVYSFFAEKYDLQVFKNIKKSEVRHQDAMIWLMEKYGIEDPSKEEEGKFHGQNLQKLYDKLTSGGNTVIDALKAGAYIEDLDIYDLKKLIKKSKNEDVKRVYTNLLRASENHYRAFSRNLSSRGADYVPEFLTKAEVAKILENNSGRKRN